MQTCSFFGHRDFVETEEKTLKLKGIVEHLIANGVDTFLFGSRSKFNDFCYKIVSDLKEKYSHIRRIFYTCVHERATLQSDREKLKKYCSTYGIDFEKICYEEEVHFCGRVKAGKGAYVERNQAMIDASDYCVFYYDENYLPKMRKYSKTSLATYQPNSGTKLALDYAKRLHKQIIFL